MTIYIVTDFVSGEFQSAWTTHELANAAAGRWDTVFPYVLDSNDPYTKVLS